MWFLAQVCSSVSFGSRQSMLFWSLFPVLLSAHLRVREMEGLPFSCAIRIKVWPLVVNQLRYRIIKKVGTLCRLDLRQLRSRIAHSQKLCETYTIDTSQPVVEEPKATMFASLQRDPCQRKRRLPVVMIFDPEVEPDRFRRSISWPLGTTVSTARWISSQN